MVVRGEGDDVFLMHEKKEELMDDVAMTSLGASHYPPVCTNIPPFVNGRTVSGQWGPTISPLQEKPSCFILWREVDSTANEIGRRSRAIQF
jgi:hypothetical protein